MFYIHPVVVNLPCTCLNFVGSNALEPHCGVQKASKQLISPAPKYACTMQCVALARKVYNSTLRWVYLQHNLHHSHDAYLKQVRLVHLLCCKNFIRSYFQSKGARATVWLWMSGLASDILIIMITWHHVEGSQHSKARTKLTIPHCSNLGHQRGFFIINKPSTSVK